MNIRVGALALALLMPALTAMPSIAHAKSVAPRQLPEGRREPRADRVVQAGMRMYYLRLNKLYAQGRGGNERLVFDATTVPGKGQKLELIAVEMSHDGDRGLVFLGDASNRTLAVLDARSGALGAERIAGVLSGAWLSSQRVIYATAKGLRLHDVGTDPLRDAAVNAPGANPVVAAFPRSTWAIATTEDGVFAAPAGTLGGDTKWRKLLDGKSDPVTQLDVDGNTLYFVSRGKLEKMDLNPGAARRTIAVQGTVTGIGLAERALIVRTDAGGDQRLWELKQGEETPIELPLPAKRRIQFSTQIQSSDVIVTLAASGSDPLAAYRWSGGKLAPIGIAARP